MFLYLNVYFIKRIKLYTLNATLGLSRGVMILPNKVDFALS